MIEKEATNQILNHVPSCPPSPSKKKSITNAKLSPCHCNNSLTISRLFQCSGELLVSICHQATSSRLQVVILKLKDLPKSIKSKLLFFFSFN